MLPEFPFEVVLPHVKGTWREATIDGAGVLRLGDVTLEIELREGGTLSASYAALSGAGWRTGVLSLHSAWGHVELEGEDGLERAWTALLALACELPEFTRGLRVLGSRRGGNTAAQARFFAPLLQARRRLEDEPDLDRRLLTFDGRVVGQRLSQVLQTLAAECFPNSASDRRALEAELFEATEPLFLRLHGLEGASSRLRAAVDAVRFDAWRSWVAAVAVIFTEADRSWSAATRVLPLPQPERGRRRSWRGYRRVFFAASLGIAALGGWV
jgi:hypothetical protein